MGASENIGRAKWQPTGEKAAQQSTFGRLFPEVQTRYNSRKRFIPSQFCDLIPLEEIDWWKLYGPAKQHLTQRSRNFSVLLYFSLHLCCFRSDPR